ncbi:MAG: DUF3783 domain-containing protein [Intestinibacillus sp.]
MKSAFHEAVYYYAPAPKVMPQPLKLLLAQLGMRFHIIDPGQTGQLLGYLVGMEGFAPQPEGTPAPVVPEEVLLLKNFAGPGIDALLSGMRRAGVPPIPLKAVVTEHNIGWTFAALAEELRQENEAMTRRAQEQQK